MRRRSTFSPLLILASMFLTSSAALGFTYVVESDGSGDHPTIQAAVSAAAVGDTVLLADGVFSGAGNWDIDFGGKDLVVKSRNGPGFSFIDCGEGYEGEHRAFIFDDGETAASVLEGIAIEDGYVQDGNGAGVLILGASPTLRGCVFNNNWAEDTGLAGTASGGAVYVQDGSPLFDTCYFNFNRATTTGGGLHYQGVGIPFLTGGAFWDNDSAEGGGIWVSAAHMKITDCQFESNGNPACVGGGIYSGWYSAGSPVTIANCMFRENRAIAGSGVAADVSESFVSNCSFYFNEGSAFSSSGTGLITDSIFYNVDAEIVMGPATVQYCWVEGGYPGTGNITGALPPVETGPYGEYYLPAGNECVDAGSDLAANICFDGAGGPFCLDECTVFANEQLDTGQVDLGFHYRRANATYDVPGDFATIQEAIDHAIDGDRIDLVSMGPYPGNIDFLGKDITIQGPLWPINVAVIQGDGMGPVVTFNNGESPAAVLKHVHVTGGDALYGGGIYIRNASPTVTECLVNGNTGTYGGGIYCNDTDAVIEGVSIYGNEALIGAGLVVTYDDVTLNDCRIYENTATAPSAGGLGGGIYCNYASLIMNNVEVYRNTATTGTGLGKGGGLYRSGFAIQPTVLTNCTFHDNTAEVGSSLAVIDVVVTVNNSIIGWGNDGSAVSCEGSATATLTCCDVYNNEGGNWVGGVAGQDGANGNFSADPIYTWPAQDMFDVVTISPCAPDNSGGCGLIGASYEGTAVATIPVAADGSGAVPSIQDAIDALMGGSTIELADGIYTGAGNRDLDFDTKSLRIRSASGDPDSCVVDCQGSDIDQHRFLILDGREGNFTRIEGLTIGNCYTDGGGGAMNIRESHPTVNDCIFADNTAFDGGAIQTYKSQAVISNCLFRDNEAANAGGGIMNHTSSPTISDCRFESNFGNWGGGGVYNHYSAPTIEGSVFAWNTSAHWGGAIHNNHPESSSVVTNCTFNQNEAPLGGHLYCRNNASLEVHNSIMTYSPTGSAAFIGASGGTVTALCCDVYGNAGGDYVDALAGQGATAGNFSAGPEFCDQVAGNFRLLDTSLCAPENNGTCGLVGALGTNCSAVSGVEEPGVIPTACHLHACYPNPFNPLTTIRFDVANPGHVHLSVYDVAGRRVRVLVDESRVAGRYEVAWDGRDSSGGRVASGVYFSVMYTAGYDQVRKMVLLK